VKGPDCPQDQAFQCAVAMVKVVLFSRRFAQIASQITQIFLMERALIFELST